MKLKDNPFLHLPEGHFKKIAEFYRTRRKEKLEEYIKKIEQKYGIIFKIFWDDERGLTSISHSPNTGLDLTNRDSFAPHNLPSLESKFAQPAVKVILRYLSLLENK